MPSFILADYFLIAIFGLIAGSFASYITYRLGEGQDLLFSYSKCTKCNYRLKFYNLVPLFSWYFQRGRCGSCNVKISLRYPLIELLYLFTFLAILFANNHQIDEMLLFLLVFATIFMMIAIIDIEYYFIPMSMQIVFLIAAVSYQFYAISDPAQMLRFCFAGLLYSAFAYSLYYLFLLTAKKEAIGPDDIKIFFTVGFLLGIEKFIDFSFFCGLFGVFFGMVWQKIKIDDTFPFAPAILTSTFLCFIIRDEYSFLENVIIKIANLLA